MLWTMPLIYPVRCAPAPSSPIQHCTPMLSRKLFENVNSLFIRAGWTCGGGVLNSCFAGVAFFSGIGFGVATGSRWGVDAGVGLGAEISCGAAFSSGVGFGAVGFAGPPCWVGAGVVSCFFSCVGVAAGRGVAEAGGVFCPGGRLPAGFGVGLTAGWFPCDPGCPGVAVGFSLDRVGEPPGAPEGFVPSRFGGTDLFPAAVAPGEAPGALGDPPGTFLFGVCFSSGEPVVVGFPPGPAGEPPGVPEGFTPSSLGGTDLFPAATALGEAPRVTFAFGEPSPGFTKLGGGFCPVTAGGEPVVPGDPACPFLPICGFT